MNTRTAVAVGGVLVLGIVVLWPRSGKVDTPVLDPAPVPGVENSGAGLNVEAVAAATGGPSLHARIVEETRERSAPAILQRIAEIENSWECPPHLRPWSLSAYSSLTTDERIEALRAGFLPPAPPIVQGPAGKPDLPAGSTREEVIAAWGRPAEVRPAQVETRFGALEVLPEWAEADVLECNEAWFYEIDGKTKSSWFFDQQGKLTSRGHSSSSETVLMMEREKRMRGRVGGRHN